MQDGDSIVITRCLEFDSFDCQLSFGVFVSTDADARSVREIGSELDKQWPEVFIYHIGIMVVTHYRTAR